jgi:hypothetical protein
LSLACTPPPRPRVIEEVPIGTDPDVPDASMAEAATSDPDAAPEADGGRAAQETPSPGGKKSHGGHSAKPVALEPTPSPPEPEAPGTGDPDRARLEAKVYGGHASVQDIRALVRICSKQHDRTCVKRASSMLTTHR